MPDRKQWGPGNPEYDEYKKFVDWAKKVYGQGVLWHVGPTKYKHTKYYTEWVSLNSPSADEWAATQEQERKAGLEPWQLTEEIGAGPYYLDDYAEPPYELGEGFEWVKVTNDPKTGVSVRPQWISQKIAEPPEVEKGILMAGGTMIQMPDGTYQDPASRMQLSDEEVKDRLDAYAKGKKGDSGELTEFQRWQMSEAALDREMQKQQMEQEKRVSLQKTQREMQTEIQTAIQAAAGPSDWITRWELINGIMPRTQLAAIQQNELALLEEAQGLSGAERLMKEQQATQLEQKYNVTAAQLRGVAAPPSWYGTPMETAQTKAGVPEERAEAGGLIDQSWTPQMIAEAQAWEAAMNQAAGNMATPSAPSWLSQFAPGQTTGKPITRERVVTPSGQQWTSTPWSIREGLRGYADFAGYEPYADILDRMAMMQTSGGSAGRWRPRVQRS